MGQFESRLHMIGHPEIGKDLADLRVKDGRIVRVRARSFGTEVPQDDPLAGTSFKPTHYRFGT